ncbi:hypothetical protein SIID45300_02020 [Candidatus Magnetaquicoccaceae bacterium FCR-1]|uniref:Uncharacterized protein n=1 Tax=Candidatus Magnetaquiglobus chichijimensis TaxID=3141448 RepID=A0ABQ0C9Z3_9PROT
MENETGDGDAQLDEPRDLAVDSTANVLDRLAILEEEVRLLKAALYTLPGALEKEKMEVRRGLEEFKGAQKRLTELANTTVQSNQKVEQLGKQVEGVKKETSSWLVVSIVCFAIFFIVSLFIRAG